MDGRSRRLDSCTSASPRLMALCVLGGTPKGAVSEKHDSAGALGWVDDNGNALLSVQWWRSATRIPRLAGESLARPFYSAGLACRTATLTSFSWSHVNRQGGGRDVEEPRATDKRRRRRAISPL